MSPLSGSRRCQSINYRRATAIVALPLLAYRRSQRNAFAGVSAPSACRHCQGIAAVGVSPLSAYPRRQRIAAIVASPLSVYRAIGVSPLSVSRRYQDVRVSPRSVRRRRQRAAAIGAPAISVCCGRRCIAISPGATRTPDLWSTGPRGPGPLRTFDVAFGNAPPRGGRNVGVTGPRGPASTSHGRRRDQRRDLTGGSDCGDLCNDSRCVNVRGVDSLTPLGFALVAVAQPGVRVATSWP